MNQKQVDKIERRTEQLLESRGKYLEDIGYHLNEDGNYQCSLPNGGVHVVPIDDMVEHTDFFWNEALQEFMDIINGQ